MGVAGWLPIRYFSLLSSVECISKAKRDRELYLVGDWLYLFDLLSCSLSRYSSSPLLHFGLPPRQFIMRTLNVQKGKSYTPWSHSAARTSISPLLYSNTLIAITMLKAFSYEKSLHKGANGV